MKPSVINTSATGHCPQCSKEFFEDENFCSECGARLLPGTGAVADSQEQNVRQKDGQVLSNPSIVAERKEVTILFADVVGSFELIKQLDPEEAQKILSPLLEAMALAVQSHHGLVLQFLGDGIMALFGAPDAREDHATAACLAAIRIREIIESKPFRDYEKVIQIRVGLNSGEAVVGMFGSRVIREYGVIGEAVHLASRMEQAARPGTIFSTHETIKLTRDNISYDYVGPIDIKGAGDPVQVYEILHQPEPEALSQEASEKNLSGFVGRAREMQWLDQALAETCEGKANCISIVGDPGIGKSRIIREFLRSDRAFGCLVLKCKANSYVNITPYHGTITMLQNYLGITSHDAAATIKERLQSKLGELSVDTDRTVPPILYLFDALDPVHPFSALDAKSRSRGIERAIKEVIAAESRIRPVIAVFEDLHWMDESTIQFIPYLADPEELPNLLTICSSRTSERHSITLPGDVMTVGALDRDSLSTLIDAVTDDRMSVSPLVDALVRRSEGNPLFAEELARAAIEDRSLWEDDRILKISDFDLEKKLPSTVRLILASRIDALPDNSKRLLQTAAVIGTEGSIRLLQAVLGEAPKRFSREIDDLVDRGFLYLKQSPGEAADFKFKHILVQEVAYSGLLLDRRKNIHEVVVDQIELLFVERLEQHSERLANHSLRAENWKKALGYLKRSGEGAVSRGAFRQAVEFYNRGLDVVQNIPNRPERVALKINMLFLLRNALQPLGDRQRIYSVLMEAENLAASVQDRHLGAWVQSYLTDHFWIVGEYENSIEAGARALKVSMASNDLKLNVVTNLPLGLSHHTKGDYRRAIVSFEQAIDAVAESDPKERFGLFVLPTPFAQSFVAWSLAELGHFEAGWAIGDEALEFAQTARHPFSIGYAHLGRGVAALRQGKTGTAIREFEAALSEQAFSDSPIGFSFVGLHLGYAYVLDGRFQEGLELLQETVKLAEANGFIARHSLRLAYLSEALLAVGKSDEALQAAQAAVTRANALGERANEAFSLFVLGRVHSALGQNTGALEVLKQAHSMAQKLDLMPLRTNCLHALAVTYRNQGDHGQADECAKHCTDLQGQLGLSLWNA